MTTKPLLSAHPDPGATTPIPVRTWCGFAVAAGAVLAVDAIVLDPFAAGSFPARLAGVVNLMLAAVGGVGLYLRAAATRHGRLLDTGFALNLMGLCALTAVAFTRNFVLDPLDTATVDMIGDQTPLTALLIAGGVLASIGFAIFGLTMTRLDRPGGWGYAILLPIGGFAAQMPVAVAALVQGLGAAAIIRLALTAMGRSVRR
ncbi:MAG: hypothetical protein ACK5RL_03865 [Acidimicrobiales bacterium]